MKSASPELIAYLNSSRQFLMADLYQFTLLDGTIIRATSWDRDVVDGGDNLLTYSQLFDHTPWTLGTSDTLGTGIIAPDGTATAYKLKASTTNTYHYTAQSVTRAAGLIYTRSLYAKAGEYNYAGLQIKDFAGVFKNAFFDLTTGQVVAGSGYLNAVASSVGSGWWRLWMAYNAEQGVGAPNDAHLISDTVPHMGTGFAGDGASGVYLWGAMENPGALPDIYVPTLASPVDTRVTYPANGLKITRSKTRCIVGLEVDQLDLTVYPSATDRIGTLSFLAALNNGVLDGATFTLKRAFLSDPTTVVGTRTLFTGQVSDCDFSRTEANIRIKSWLELLNVNVPRNLYQAGCRWTWGDSGCGINKEAYAAVGALSGGSTNLSLNVTGLTQATGYFDQGVLLFTSGNLLGIKRTILGYTHGAPSVLALGLPLPRNPGYGDTFKVYPGCNKIAGHKDLFTGQFVLDGDCPVKFNNLLRFGGMPFIPVPETAR